MAAITGKMRIGADSAPRSAYSSGQRSRNPNYIAARAVGSYMPRLTRKAFEKFGFSAATLLTDWSSIVGNDVASYTAPERLKWPRGVEYSSEIESGSEGRPGATLVLRVDPARALDVQYKTAQIIERINGYFGYNAIVTVRIVQGAVARAIATQAPPPPRRHSMTRTSAPASLSGIADERLRDALTRLQASIRG